MSNTVVIENLDMPHRAAPFFQPRAEKLDTKQGCVYAQKNAHATQLSFYRRICLGDWNMP
jgi:hypothetical protein